MKLLFNHEAFALQLHSSQDHDHLLDLDLEKNFFTPYGLFVPLYTSGIQLIRALRGEFPLSALRKVMVNTRFLHVNHLGQVWYLSASTPNNDIAWEQITTPTWVMSGFMGNDKTNSIAFHHLLKGCKTIQTAAKRLDRIAYDGFYEPDFFQVSDVAKRLTELGHTRPFFHTEFIDLFESTP